VENHKEAAMPRRLGKLKNVWLVEKQVLVRDPRTGKKRAVRRAIVRWRDGTATSERTFPDPIAAGRFASDKIDQLDGNRTATFDTPDVTFGEWRDSYLASRFADYETWKRGEIKSVGDTYARLLIRAAKAFVEKIGDRRLRDYRPTDFDAFRSKLVAEGQLRPATIEGHLMRLKTIFRAAEENKLLARSPRIKVRQVLYEKPALDAEQIKEIFKAARTWPRTEHLSNKATTGRIYPVLVTLYYTAVRLGELIHLSWDDVRRDESGRIVELLIQPKEWVVTNAEGKRQRLRWQPKDREIRAIPVHPNVAEALDALSKEATSRWVFTNTDGQQWKACSLDSFLRRFEEATGFALGFHIWRRSALTHLHDAGVPPGHIQAIAGHSSLSTTMRYVRKNATGTATAILALKDMG
jgi:integrase